jgi:hypothetical protein
MVISSTSFVCMYHDMEGDSSAPVREEGEKKARDRGRRVLGRNRKEKRKKRLVTQVLPPPLFSTCLLFWIL